MFRSIRYFHEIVRTGSFSEAAAACHISQSAISQQIQSLERELGFTLFERKGRGIQLTPAGEYFCRKTLVLLSDYDRICREAEKIASGDGATLRLGYLRSYGSVEFQLAVEEFAARFPKVDIDIFRGTHEETYRMLVSGQIDLNFNDQRRRFSDRYNNLILTTVPCCIEISSRHPLAQLDRINTEELKNLPGILVSSPAEREVESEYYRNIFGFSGDFLFAENLEDARLMVVSGKGFIPADGSGKVENFAGTITRIPLIHKGEPLTRNYCAFWSRENSGYYVETFADILKKQFHTDEE